MSLKAKGLLSMMLSFNAETWEWSIAGLAAMCKDGVDSVREGLRELSEKGYFFKARARNDHGQLGKAEYWVFEEPQDLNALDLVPPVVSKPPPCADPPPGPETEAQLMLDLPILENPILANPIQEKPIQAEPILDNPPQINTNRTNTEERNKNHTKYQPYQSYQSNQSGWDVPQRRELYNGMTLEEVKAYVQEKVEYDCISTEKRFDKEMIDEIVEIMVEILISHCDSFKVSGRQIPYDLAVQRVESYDYWMTRYLLTSLCESFTEVKNVRQYLLAAILNAPTTISNKVDSEFRHDMPWLREQKRRSP